jgi:hypothetical protein
VKWLHHRNPEGPKYFVYVSDTKVDMLFNQIPRDLRDRIAVELDISPINLGIKLAEKTPAEKNRFSKARLVARYCEENLGVGTIDAPQSYFKGRMPLKWGRYGSTSAKERGGRPLTHTFVKEETVLFTGSTSHTVLAMGGSRRHLISSIGHSYTDSFSDTESISELMIREELPPRSDPYLDYDKIEAGILYAAFLAVQKQRGPEQRVEFLAKKLLFGPPSRLYYFDRNSKSRLIPEGTNVLLSSPIYVAYADDRTEAS